MNRLIHDFIIIDDDSCHNIVCALSLKKAFVPANINIAGFTNVTEGIEYIEKNVGFKDTKTMLFLDVHMPGISGWDVLTIIEAMPKFVKNNLVVYMLSSTANYRDRDKAMQFSCVKDFLQKPLSEHLVRVTEEVAELNLSQRIYA